MRLRNRETGEIGEIRYENHELYVDTDGGFTYWLRTIAELNERWEDYKPTDPLIKDERIRKAVRAWAKANDLVALKIVNEHCDCCEVIGRCDSRNVCLIIEFKTTIAHANKNQFYTIEELCGEEEE